MKVNKLIAALCLGLTLSGISAGVLSAGIEVRFSPDGSGEALVLRSINLARQLIA